MIYLIAGASHSGKSALAKRLLVKHHIATLSIDHLKIGLIRSKTTELSVYDDEALTQYLWPIIREIIKTAIENKQSLIIEGVYIPFDFRKDFTFNELKQIHYICLIMTKNYITHNFDLIKEYANVVEHRLENDLNKEMLIQDNLINYEMCSKYKLPMLIIDKTYHVNIDIETLKKL